MKVTVVPAQVTTVEDRIMGSLGFTQMMILMLPLFLGAGIFVLLPPFVGGSMYKYICIGAITLLSCILAVRIRGKIVALWLSTIIRYNLRPKYYLFNKNTAIHRQDYRMCNTEIESVKPEISEVKSPVTKLAVSDTVSVLTAIENPAMKFRFETSKKGGLNVRLTEIQE